MVVGDYRKFLTAIITLKVDVDMSVGMGKPTRNLTEVVKKFLKDELNITDVNTTEEAATHKELLKYLQKKVNDNNDLQISRAQYIRKFKLIHDDFSMDGDDLTPTLKLKRKVVQQKYQKIIEEMYEDEELPAAKI